MTITWWRIFLVGALVLCVAGPGTARRSVSPKQKKADEIIRKHVEAIGGMEKIKALKSLSADGVFKQAGLELPFTLWMKRPNRSRMDLEFHGQKFIQAYDGKTAWWVNPLFGAAEPTEMPKEYATPMLRWTDFDGPLVDYQQKRHRVEYEGEEQVGTARVYKIRLALFNGDVWHVYIDSKTYLEVKRAFQQTYGGRTKDVTTWIRRYATVNGVNVYSVVEGEGLDGSPYTMTFRSFKANPEIDDAKFAKP